MKNIIIRICNGIFNVLYTGVLFNLSLKKIREVKMLSGYNARVTLILSIIGIILSLVMCYLVGKWEQEYKKQEREKNLNLSKIDHNSLCETETYKVDGIDGK